MRPCIAALAAAATLLAATGTGRAEGDKDRRPVLTKRQSARAAALRQRGLEHFLAREYQLASDDLMEAYRLDKRPETLFGWAEAVRAAGDCELASRIYRRLFEKTTDIKLTRQAEVGLAVCEGQTSASGGAEALASIAPVTSGGASDLGIQGAIGGGTPIDDHVELTDDAEPAPAKPAPEPTPHTTSYILLGSGGLIRAYGGTAALCLREAVKVELVETATASIACPFSDLTRVQARLAALAGMQMREQVFTDTGAILTISAPKSEIDGVTRLVTDLTSGRALIRWDQ